jgi:hypothetical protein
MNDDLYWDVYEELILIWGSKPTYEEVQKEIMERFSLPKEKEDGRERI